jgi:hypothetical protein
MRRTCLVLTLFAMATAQAAAVTQTRPDFSGAWVFDADHSSKTQIAYVTIVSSDGSRVPTEREVPLVPTLGNEFKATQDAKTLTIERTLTPTSVPMTINGVTKEPTKGDAVTYRVVYALDGSETRNKAPSPRLGEPEIERVGIATWDGDRLVIKEGRTAPPDAPKTQRTFRLDVGGILLIETLTPAPNGAPPAKTTTAYKKSR